jgi:hypothetical protein|tara:strand:- start:412 stop:612 length:201 start_codon:yes stop_codon:yes gene_type:complete
MESCEGETMPQKRTEEDTRRAPPRTRGRSFVVFEVVVEEAEPEPEAEETVELDSPFFNAAFRLARS